MSEPKVMGERPLSPHLQIYKPMLTMMMSIVHRITGAALYFGTALLVYWLFSLMAGPKAYAAAQACFGSIFGKLVLFGYTWALLHHMMGGIRHLIWDTGRGLEHPTREYIVLGTLIASLGLTAVVWLIYFAK